MKRILLAAILFCASGCGDDSPTGPKAGDLLTAELPGGAEMELVWIEPGTFMMGSPQNEIDQLNTDGDTDWYSREGPQHEVTISRGFWLGEYELTQGQWKSTMGTTPWLDGDYVQSNANHPAVGLLWDEVQSFIDKLNEASGEEIYRLPTEAEWEYACRAGTETRWSFGNGESRLGDFAWYADNPLAGEERYAHAVGRKLPNPWGLYDMHGNVFELCRDWYGDYASEAQTDPVGPATGSFRVFRGGAFDNFGQAVRSAFRFSIPLYDREKYFGARLLRTR